MTPADASFSLRMETFFSSAILASRSAFRSRESLSIRSPCSAIIRISAAFVVLAAAPEAGWSLTRLAGGGASAICSEAVLALAPRSDEIAGWGFSG